MIYIGSDKPEVERTSEWNVYVYYKFFFLFVFLEPKKEVKEGVMSL